MGIVYKILCNETGECYIGSVNTKNLYIKREISHRTLNSKCSSKQIIERDNYTFSIVEENIFIDIELRKREQYWIDTSHHVINTNRAYQSIEEYYRIYHDKNKEKINARRRELREMKRLENL